MVSLIKPLEVEFNERNLFVASEGRCKPHIKKDFVVDPLRCGEEMRRRKKLRKQQ